jgi:SAM-dependent methyltransferase
MVGPDETERRLRVEELRRRFLRHTRAAFRRLPALDRPRILDVGCGSGLVTLELARLANGEVVGVDPDREAIARLRGRVERAGLADRVRAVEGSFLDAELVAGSFDVLWAEGVLHLLDPERWLPAARRRMRPHGLLVAHETVGWLDGLAPDLDRFGLVCADRHALPRRCWWNDYGEPLERRIRAVRDAGGESAELARHEREVAAMKADPDRYESAFFFLRRSATSPT